MDPILEQFTLGLYRSNVALYNGEGQDITQYLSGYYTAPSGGVVTSLANLGSGEYTGDMSVASGAMRSANFKSGTLGWQLSHDGTLEAVNATLSGVITATSGTIGGFTVGATTITGGTLILNSTGTIKTATTGQRVEINTDTLILYDSSAQVIKFGTADVGSGDTRAVQIALNSNSLSGISISTSTDATLGIRMDSSSNVTFNALRIDLNNTGSGNDGYCIFLKHYGTSASSYGIDIDKKGAGNAIRIFSTSSTDAVEINVSDNDAATALTLNGNDSSRTAPLLYLDDLSTAGPGLRIETDYTVALDIINNNANVGAVQIVTSVNSGSNAIGMRISITNAGAGTEYAFEFAGSEYDGTKTGVSGLTGVIKVLTSDGLGYIPVYDTAT